ncbi:UBN2 domain-containing protein [Cephalotus follicularis]|uniref:UBN2 domain-containing protein n=1 Tax=Cephalotus follicularis TaxID=3775 RepID=A0A1Q3CV65_CEPFO|nr:UBN2 domain-containing protein [Cephalotus follicularis]
MSSIEVLNGSNYRKWRQDLDILLGILDLDLAFREERPELPAEDSSHEEKAKYDKWEGANRMCLMVMCRTMSEAICGGVPESENASQFLESVKEKLVESEKAKSGTLMTSLTNMHYDGNGNVCEHNMKMFDMVSKLKSLDVVISNSFLVHLALNFLPLQFGQLKVTYNASREKWG